MSAPHLPHLQPGYFPSVDMSLSYNTPHPPLSTYSLPRPTLSFDDPPFDFTPGSSRPPHVYSNFSVFEDSVSSPRFLRLTTTVISTDPSTQKRLQIPIAAVWRPLCELPPDEQPPPVIDEAANGPFRCSNCQSYANPRFSFVPGQQSVVCNLCGCTSPYSRDLFIPLAGTFDFQVSNEFIIAPPPLNTLLLCFDISPSSEAINLRQHAIAAVLSALDSIPCPDRSRVAVMAFSQRFRVYRANGGGRPAEIVIGDVSEPFAVESIGAVSFRLDSDREGLRRFLLQWGKDTVGGNEALDAGNATELTTGAVAGMAKELLAGAGGRVLIFVNSLGRVRTDPGCTVNEHRTNKAEKETEIQRKQLLEGMGKLGRDCCAEGVTFDFFVGGGEKDVDLPAMAVLSELTGGDLHYFPKYSPRSRSKLQSALYRTLVRNTVFQVLIRIRCSATLEIDNFIGSFTQLSRTDLQLASLHADKAITIVFKPNSTLSPGDVQHIQCALLFTTLEGRRILRVFNVSLNSTESVSEIYRNTDCETLASVILKKFSQQSLQKPPIRIKSDILEWLTALLRQYRKQCLLQQSNSCLMLPFSLQYLPIFTLSMLKSACFAENVGKCTHIAYVSRVKSLSVERTFPLLYPRIYQVDDLTRQEQQPGLVDRGRVVLPKVIAAAGSQMERNGAYLIDNGETIVLFIGAEVSSEFLSSVRPSQAFDVSSYSDLLEFASFGLPSLETGYSQRIHVIVKEIRRKNQAPQEVVEIALQEVQWMYRDGQPVEDLMVEDESTHEQSYPSFLQSLFSLLSA